MKNKKNEDLIKQEYSNLEDLIIKKSKKISNNPLFNLETPESEYLEFIKFLKNSNEEKIIDYIKREDIFESLTKGIKSNIKQIINSPKNKENRVELNHFLLNMISDIYFKIDPSFGRHSEDVAEHCKNISSFYNFLDNKTIYEKGILHDIGKLITKGNGLNAWNRIYNQEDPLSTQLYLRYAKKHTIIGEEILKSFYPFFQNSIDIAKYHHERLDGKGYPEGIYELTFEIQAIGLIDCYSSMMTTKFIDYGEVKSKDFVFLEIEKMRGRFENSIIDLVKDYVQEIHTSFYNFEWQKSIISNKK